MNLLTLFFLLLCACILTHAQLSLSYAALGLGLWFQKMIPSLLPFMILSGIMVRMNLTEKVSMIAYPVIRPLYQVRRNVCYAMLMGFLCGFPMGARVVDDLYLREKLSKREAEYLLAFCNNIGPVYFCSFALPLLNRKLLLPYLCGMYGIPLLYGLLLRRTLYRDLPLPQDPARRTVSSAHSASAPLISCEADAGRHPYKAPLFGRRISRETPAPKSSSPGKSARTCSLAEALLEETDSSIHAAVQSILTLGGYMILFNLLNLLPHILLGRPLPVLAPLLEITGGLGQLQAAMPLYSLLALSFGGFSCIAQTYSCISGSDLSIGKYVLHKIVLTLLTGLFYLGWFLLLPASFLR